MPLISVSDIGNGSGGDVTYHFALNFNIPQSELCWMEVEDTFKTLMTPANGRAALRKRMTGSHHGHHGN